MASQNYVVVPNAIITAEGHSPAKRLLVALLAHTMPRLRGGRAVLSTAKTYEQIKGISGICSDTTLSAAIRQLCAAGILRRTNHYGYSQTRSRMERLTNTYSLDRAYIRYLADRTGYTLVPRSLLRCDLTNAQFAIALLLYKLAGSRGVARPSIRAIAATLRLALSTVVLALRELRRMELFIRILRRYIGRRGGVAYRTNRYCCTASPFAISRRRRGLATIVSMFGPETGRICCNTGVSKNGEQVLLTG